MAHRTARRGAFGIALVLVCTALIPLGVGSATAATAKPKQGGSATVLHVAQPTNFDPAKSGDLSPGGGGTYGIYDALISLDPVTTQIRPRLASAVTPNADGTVWTIKLRTTTFTDGTPFNADAVKFNWERLKDPAVGASCGSVVAGMTAIDVVDPQTVRVTLATATSGFYQYLAFSGCLSQIGSPTAITAAGANVGTSPETSIGAGPYVLKEFVRGDHITVQRNPKYWDSPRPYIDTITFKPVQLASQQVDSVSTGAAQLAVFPLAGPDITRAKQMGVKVVGFYPPGGVGIGFRQSGALADMRVRQAFILATDLEDFNVKVTGGTAPTMSTYFPKGNQYYLPGTEQPTNNLKKAQSLIDAYVKDNGPVTVTIIEPESVKTEVEALQQQWSRLKDVTVNVNPVTSTVAATLVLSCNFDVGYVGTSSAVTAEGFYQAYYSKSASNVCHLADDQLDSLILQARGETNPAAQKKLFNQIVARLWDLNWFVMTRRLYEPSFVGKTLKGITLINANTVDITKMWLAS